MSARPKHALQVQAQPHQFAFQKVNAIAYALLLTFNCWLKRKQLIWKDTKKLGLFQVANLCTQQTRQAVILSCPQKLMMDIHVLILNRELLMQSITLLRDPNTYLDARNLTKDMSNLVENLSQMSLPSRLCQAFTRLFLRCQNTKYQIRPNRTTSIAFGQGPLSNGIALKKKN